MTESAAPNPNDQDQDEEEEVTVVPASRSTPPIPGLYIFPELLDPAIARSTLASISDADLFVGGQRDQVMLFARRAEGGHISTSTSSTTTAPSSTSSSSLPDYLQTLLAEIQRILTPHLEPDPEAHTALFEQDLARQAILNLYAPGQGISPHIDLPTRYADGILGVSLTGGCVMSFAHERTGEAHDVYLPPRSVYAFVREARWNWAHGIEARGQDVVLSTKGRKETILRDLRVSVTFRWMKEGADVLS